MRKSILLGAALLAACSKPHQPGEEPAEPPVLRSEAVRDVASSGVDVTAAPGVAFNYSYAFRLPGNRIGQVQEAHAQACEKLGIDRCRITGMRYRLVNQKDVQAMLALRLDPKIARQFGKAATETVTKSDGMLVDQEITGEDVATRISGATKTESDLRQELQRIEAELARPPRASGINASPEPVLDRQGLRDRAEEIRQQLRDLADRKGADQEALAGTPMVFNYGSGSVVPGFDVRSPLKDALQQSADNFVGGFAAILVILITLIPWILVGWLVVWGFRRVGLRLGWFQSSRGYRSAAEAEPEPAPSRRTKARNSDEA
jgi:hypothetical protein